MAKMTVNIINFDLKKVLLMLFVIISMIFYIVIILVEIKFQPLKKAEKSRCARTSKNPFYSQVILKKINQ